MDYQLLAFAAIAALGGPLTLFIVTKFGLVGGVPRDQAKIQVEFEARRLDMEGKRLQSQLDLETKKLEVEEKRIQVENKRLEIGEEEMRLRARQAEVQSELKKMDMAQRAMAQGSRNINPSMGFRQPAPPPLPQYRGNPNGT